MDDNEYQDHVIDKITPDDDGFTITGMDGFCLFVRNKDGLPLPEAGDVARYYGRGLGYTVRGVSVGDNVYYYETNEDYDARMQREKEVEREKKRKQFEDDRAKWDADVAALPDVFQDRIRYFMDGVDDWGPKFGGYEMFVCQEAVKFAEALKTSERITEFYKMDVEDQKLLVDWDDNHSGNTFGASCMLAKLYLDRPELVAKMHGALCAMVGCDYYGCYASREGDTETP